MKSNRRHAIILRLLVVFAHTLRSHCVLFLPKGTTQYSQQQEPYQQGPPQQQGYPPQQQYPGQQGYPPQQQGYGESVFLL